METIFGPVPSRRLGRSIGVNNVPPKQCTYSCIYCQLGRAIIMSTERKAFYAPEELISSVQERIEAMLNQGEKIDYLTIVPDGEPTLDIHLGKLIKGLKETGIPTAMITNSSLLGDQELHRELMELDWISLKVDAITETVWKKIDRPHKNIDHQAILKGMQQFAAEFSKKTGSFLAAESMLIQDFNTDTEELTRMAEFIASLKPDSSYIAVPTRPPAETWAEAAGEEAITRAYSIFSRLIPKVEHLIGYEGNEFSSTGDSREDLLSITAVHPMRDDAVAALLKKNNSSQDVVDELLKSKQLLANSYHGHTYYVRRFKDRQMGSQQH